MTERGNPFVLGKPIKEPEDFYGRRVELNELFEAIVNMQPVALVGEHRCGNTSLLYQMRHPDVQATFLDDGERGRLLFAFVNAQLAAESQDALFRRIARALRRADPDSEANFESDIDALWLEDYLEELADRDKRLVLLLDEFEVLASFPARFWEWFRGLITEYDLSIVVATRVELGEFRDEWGSGSPFFNMFRSIYVGNFSADEVDQFLKAVGESTGMDFMAIAPTIGELAGRFPYYLQVATALFHEHALRDGTLGGEEQVEAVQREMADRVSAHFDDIWSKLPTDEREALSWMAVEARPDPKDSISFDQAMPSLERRGYVVEGRIFSRVFAEDVQQRLRRIELNADTGEVTIEKRFVDLPPKEFSLLRFLLDREGDIVTKDEIASAVWPEYRQLSLGVTDSMIQKAISRLRKEVDGAEGGFIHIESIRGQGYRFQNTSVFEYYHHRADRNGVPQEASVS